jgi:hypothetical protein
MKLNLIKNEATHKQLSELIKNKLNEYLDMHREALPDLILKLVEEENRTKKATQEHLKSKGKKIIKEFVEWMWEEFKQYGNPETPNAREQTDKKRPHEALPPTGKIKCLGPELQVNIPGEEAKLADTELAVKKKERRKPHNTDVSEKIRNEPSSTLVKSKDDNKVIL